MDPNFLRLVLFIAGVVLVLGIYLWDRRKRVSNRMREMRDARDAGEPNLGAGAAASGPSVEAQLQDEMSDLEEELLSPPSVAAEEKEPDPERKSRKGWFGQRKAEPTERAPQGNETPIPIPEQGIPTKIVQINVVAGDRPFSGNDILRASGETDLRLGSMQIFHRYPTGNAQGAVLFSMASLVEPGTFPPDEMEEFRTPGLTLFAQLPGPYDGMAVFADMLFTAQRLGELLGGELLDSTRSALTKQTIDHIREEILEHQRKVQLLRKKG